MTTILEGSTATSERAFSLLFILVAWRNLWRNKRRTWLSVGGIAFSLFLVVTGMAFQTGTYDDMINLGARLGHSHIQVQHPDYLDNPRVKNTFYDALGTSRSIAQIPDVAGVAMRTESFALVSVGERSYGAMVVGVEPNKEPSVSDFPSLLVEGTYLSDVGHAYIGSALARNLSAAVGDEIVILGTGKTGNLAPMLLTIGGIFTTGITDVDRSYVQVRIEAFQEAFEFGDEIHRLLVSVSDLAQLNSVVAEMGRIVSDEVVVHDWEILMPEIRQGIDLDKISAQFMYWMLLAVVLLSIVNTFVMTVFERSREFGMLVAVGMRPRQIIGMVVIESIALWIVGSVVGLLVCLAVVIPTSWVGVPMPAAATEVSMGGMQIPTHIYPGLDASTLLTGPLVLGVGTVLGAMLPALRIRTLKPVEALREEE
jgi:putative ABC transport system permease protein|tara:strand:+ start:14124 stop:15398 length:1275 start_codon:yes stop_codon:yes gene_type:complete